VTVAADGLASTLRASSNAPVVLVVGSGYRPYREYILRTLSRHFRLWLLNSREATWQLPYIVGASRVDTADPGSMHLAAREICREISVDGVFTYDESQVIFCAKLAEDLGLPGSPPETIRVCRDKAATRAALRAAGIPQPASRAVDSIGEARAAADAIGYPVIVKARGLAGSFGVVRADDPDAVVSAYRSANGATFSGMPRYETGNVLVEEYLTGPEISMDSVIVAGEVSPTVLARKHIGMEPFFVETGHDVDAADPLLSDANLLGQLRRIHRALGFVYGATHTEFRLGGAGPRLIEINPRLGGDLIPYLGWLATGTDPVLAAARAATGQRPETAPHHSKAAAVRFLYPDRPCEVRDIVVHEKRFGPAIRETGVTAAPGDRLDLPPDAYLSRYGHVIAVGDDIGQVLADLARVEELIELVPVPEAG
jgi:biotin carboxylase